MIDEAQKIKDDVELKIRLLRIEFMILKMNHIPSAPVERVIAAYERALHDLKKIIERLLEHGE